ncbi:MAG: amidase family protein [Bryobacteraceae bacterium]
MQPFEASISALERALQSNRITCRAVVQFYLDRIQTYDKAGPALNAVQTINPAALAEADELDAKFRTSGLVGPLHCVPVLVKNQVETTDMPTTYGSILFKNFVPHRDAAIVTKLKTAGVLILHKAMMGRSHPATSAGDLEWYWLKIRMHQ